MVLTIPPFFSAEVGKNTVLLNLEWRKLKGLRELIRALNVSVRRLRAKTLVF